MSLTPFQKAGLRQHIHNKSQILDDDGNPAIGEGGGVTSGEVDAAIAAAIAAISPTFTGAKAYMNGTQAVTTGADRVITFNAEDFDSNGYHDLATNNSRFIVPAGKGGKYQLIGHIYGISGSSHDIRFRINGTTLVSDVLYNPTAGAAMTISALVALAAGDYVELVINPGGNVTLGHASAREAMNDMSVEWRGA